MIFDEQTVKAIQNGRKCVTRRLPRADGRRPAVPGKIHKVKKDRTDRTYGTILITDCQLVKLSDMNDTEAKMEGFNTVDEYLEYFEKVNKVNNPDQMVWRIEFEVADNPKHYKNIGRIDRTDPRNGIFVVSNGIEANDNDIVYISNPDAVLEDIMWDLMKYQCEFLVNDAYIDKDKQEFVIDISEEYQNQYKPCTIKQFKDWITSEDCDWFYEVYKFEEFEWGLRVFLKF